MKTRQGFVSNSSASSFIIGIGVVEDEDKFRQACADVKLPLDGKWDSVYIKTLSEILADAAESSWAEPLVRGTRIEVEAFDGSTVSLDYSELDGDTKIAVMEMSGELDDDYSFWNDEYGEYNFDKSPTDSDYEKMSVFSESCGIKKGMATGGAGRNG